MKCRRGYELEVLQSGAGWYVGTKDGWMPNCRLTEYFGTAETTVDILTCMEEDVVSRAVYVRDSADNDFCNGCKGCFEEGN